MQQQGIQKQKGILSACKYFFSALRAIPKNHKTENKWWKRTN